MNIRCPICHRDSFHERPSGMEHFCLKAGKWITWRAGVFKVPASLEKQVREALCSPESSA